MKGKFFVYLLIGIIFIGGIFLMFYFMFGNQETLPEVQENVSESVVVECVENWIFTGWSTCMNGVKKRACTEVNSCGTEEEKPGLWQNCLFSKTKPFYVSYNDTGVSVPKTYCDGPTAPDCGVAYPGDVSEVVFQKDGGEMRIPNYDEDCSLVCFGENLLDDCSVAEVNLEDGDGVQVMQVLGLNNGLCEMRLDVLSSIEYPELANTYLTCPVPLDSMFELSCFFGSCLEKGMPGQTTMNIMGSMMFSALFEEDSPCEGSLIDVLKSS